MSISRLIFTDKELLASSKDVTPEEKAQLLSVDFGKTSSIQYLRKLKTKPAYYTTILSSGRFAVVRILPGKASDLENLSRVFFAAILNIDDWLDELNCDIEPLIFEKSLWQWLGGKTLPNEKVEGQTLVFGPDEKTRQMALNMLTLIEGLADNTKSKVIIEEQYIDYQSFRWLNMILPKDLRKTFTYSVRATTTEMNVLVTSLAEDANIGAVSNNVVLWRPGVKINTATPFTDTIRQLWLNDQLPPMAYINNHTNFKSTMGESSEGETTSNAKKIILNYIAKNPVKAKTQSRLKYKSKTKKVMASTVLAIITALLVFGGLWVKQQLSIYKINEKGQSFLDENSLAMIFQSQVPLKPLLDENDEIIDEIQQFITKSSTKKLNLIESKLVRWKEQAVSAMGQQKKIETLFGEMTEFNIESLPKFYPKPGFIQRLDKYYNQLKNTQDNLVLPSNDYIIKLQNKLKTIEKYNLSLKDILENFFVQTEQLEETAKNIEKPEFFIEELFEEYEEFDEQIINLQQQQSLINATMSSRSDDVDKATETMSKLSKLESFTTDQIDALNSYKINAENFIDAFNMKYQLALNQPDKIQENINQLKFLADSAKRFWPSNPDNNEINVRYQNILDYEKLLSIEQELIEIGTSVDINDLAAIDEQLEILDNIASQIDEIVTSESKILDLIDKVNLLMEDLQKGLTQKNRDIQSLNLQKQTEIDKLSKIISKLIAPYSSRPTLTELRDKYNVLVDAREQLESLKQKWSDDDLLISSELEIEKFYSENMELVPLNEIYLQLTRMEMDISKDISLKEIYRESFQITKNQFEKNKNGYPSKFLSLINAAELRIIRLKRLLVSTS